MRRKIFSLAFGAILLFIFTACKEDGGIYEPTDEAICVGQIVDSESPINEQIEHVFTIEVSDSISLRVLSDRIPGGEDTVSYDVLSGIFISDFLLGSCYPIEFCEFNHQYQDGHVKLVFVSNVDIENFQFVEIFNMTIGGKKYPFIGNALFSIERLRANQPFITTWKPCGNERGVSFVDEYGNTRTFTFKENYVGDGTYLFMISEVDMDAFAEDFRVVTDTFAVYLDEEIVIIHEVITLQVSDSIYLRFLHGLFPGATEYFESEKPMPSETFIADFLSMSYSSIEFCEFNHQYHAGHQKLVFVFDVDVASFQFIEFNFMTNEMGNYYITGDAIFSVDVLKANQPFVTTWLWRGHQALRGVSFLDEHGNTRVFTFGDQMSGIGPLFLIFEHK